jgi:EpsI family protein
VTFILVSIAVPIVANWLRAYMIVMLGHLSSNRLATGIDHVIYGWIFFGVVMAVLFAIGARWREDESAPAQGMSLEMGHSAPSVSSGSDARVAVAVVASILTIGAWPLTLARALHGDHEDVAALARISGGNGWSAVPDTITKWRPELVPPSAIISQTFEKNGVRAGLYVALYRGQTTESKAISSRNALVRTTNKQWRQLRAPPAVIEAGADSLELASAVVEGHRQRLAVWRWYWVDGRATSSDFVAKLLQLVSIVRGHGDAVAWVIIYTPIGADEATPWRVLNDFASAIVGRVNVALAGTTND